MNGCKLTDKWVWISSQYLLRRKLEPNSHIKIKQLIIKRTRIRQWCWLQNFVNILKTLNTIYLKGVILYVI